MMTTSTTRRKEDRGHDILAVSRDQLGLETAWAVECKRYRPEHPVGVDVVHVLYGVKHGLGLPQALLVTTSSLTRGAREFADSVGDIKVADSDVLIDWLAKYKRPSRAESHVSTKRFQSRSAQKLDLTDSLEERDSLPSDSLHACAPF